MSTYLVAFVIGAYDYVETRDNNQVLIRVYTPAGKKEQGLFALKVGLRVFRRHPLIDLSTMRQSTIDVLRVSRGTSRSFRSGYQWVFVVLLLHLITITSSRHDIEMENMLNVIFCSFIDSSSNPSILCSIFWHQISSE